MPYPEDVVPSGPDAWPSRAAELERVVARLDAVERRLRRGPPSPADRSGDTEDARDGGYPGRPRVPAPLSSPLMHLSLPAYVAVAVNQVEDALLHRDVALHEGDEDRARAHEERAAGVACAALSRAARGFTLPADIPLDRAGNFLRTGTVAGDLTMPAFRDQEIALLHLAGLGRDLAAEHFDAALAEFRRRSPQLDTAEDVRGALEAAAEAACRTHRLLLDGRRKAEKALRRSRWRRGLVLALGGTAIAVSNAAAASVIGPLAVGASAVLGGGAAGAVVDVFKT